MGRKTKRREYVEQVQVSTIQSRVGRGTNCELLDPIIRRDFFLFFHIQIAMEKWARL